MSKAAFFLLLFGYAGLGLVAFQKAQAAAQKSTSSSKSSTSTQKKTASKSPSTKRSTTSTAKKKTSSSKRTTSSRTSRRRRTASWRRGQQQPTPERYKEIQQALIDRGYLEGLATGRWGTESADALRRFQQDQKLEATGKLNSLSLIALGLGPKREVAAQNGRVAPAEPKAEP